MRKQFSRDEAKSVVESVALSRRKSIPFAHDRAACSPCTAALEPCAPADDAAAPRGGDGPPHSLIPNLSAPMIRCRHTTATSGLRSLTNPRVFIWPATLFYSSITPRLLARLVYFYSPPPQPHSIFLCQENPAFEQSICCEVRFKKK